MKFKQLRIAVFFLLVFSTVQATPYHWECGTFTIDATDTLIYCPQISTDYIYFTITNTGTADIYVRQIINSTNLPTGWSFNMCNPNGCWGPNIVADTFLVPASGFVTARFDFHSDTTIGTGITSVRFDDAASPAINGATFNLHAVSLGTGVNEIAGDNSSILLYPNPVMNELVVGSSEFGDKIELTIFSAVGKKVYKEHRTSDIGHRTISVADLPSGIYFVKVKGEKEERMGKFVKE
jgi:hypothetical protein